MTRNRIRHALTTCTALGLMACPVGLAHAAANQPRQTPMVTLSGNVRPEATAANDRGALSGDMMLNHMMLVLRRSPQQEAAFQARIQSMYRPGSPDFHHWLTPEEIGQQYGPSATELQMLVEWLRKNGFTVNRVSSSGLIVDFSGTVAQLNAAMRVAMHELNVNGKHHIANMNNPQVPAELANYIVGIASLNDFRPKPANTGVTSAHIEPMSKAVVPAGQNNGATPGFTVNSSYQLVVPDDLHTIYNFKGAYKKGFTGRGQTVVVIEDTDVYSTDDWNIFRKTFGLSKYAHGSFTQIHPGGCMDPGVLPGNDAEAILDAEYSSAAAPDAAIQLASCADTQTTFGGLIAMAYLVDQPVPPPVISISYGECEAALGAAGNAIYNYVYQQAASEGVSVFVSSGDEGAASCDANQPAAQYGIAVSGFASTPYNVAVGGTDYGDSYAGTNAQYWNANNTPTYGSAKSYIPEIPWNDSCASTLITNVEGYNVPYGANGFCNSALGEKYFLTTASGSGGPSQCAYGNTSPLPNTPAVSGTCMGYAKPNYQAGVPGNPNDGLRDLPDVSLFAANGVWGHYYVFCYSDPGANLGGAPCTGNPAGWSGAGGTSFAAPIVAGVQALINQSQKAPQGNPNYVYYYFAKAQFSLYPNSCVSTLGNGIDNRCIFNDVAQGDNDVNCLGSFSCYTPSGKNGVLSTTSKAYSKAYNSNMGWDFATGIGTLNVGNLVDDWHYAFTQ